MLTEHSLTEIKRVEFERIRSRSPGDWVQHVDDPESLGTIVSRAHSSSSSTVVVLWSREPRLDPHAVATARVQHHVRNVVNQFVGQPNDTNSLQLLQNKIQSAMASLTHQGVITAWFVDKINLSLANPTEHSVRIQFNIRPSLTTMTIDIRIGL